MIDNIHISIIIPSFNREKYIADTLLSVLNQSYSNWECLIVDDGSTDGTIKIIEDYCKNDNRFQLIIRHREPKGGNTCRNIGVEKSTGDYVIFLDSDDILMTTCLENRIDKINKIGENDILIKGTYKMFESEETNIFSNRLAKPHSDYLSLFLRLEHPWNIMCGTWKAEVLKESKPFDESLPRLQDPDFHIRMLSKYDGRVHYEYREVDNYHIIHTAKSARKSINWLKTIVIAYQTFFIKYHQRFADSPYVYDLYSGVSRSIANLMTKIKQSEHRDFTLISNYLGSLVMHGIIDKNQKNKIEGILKVNKLFPHFRGSARVNIAMFNYILKKKNLEGAKN